MTDGPKQAPPLLSVADLASIYTRTIAIGCQPEEKMMNAQKYRKKPVEIEAMQWDGTAEGATEIINWILANGGTARYECSDPIRCEEHDGDCPHYIVIATLEGTMRARLGDRIIRGVQGEFYPCKPDIFDATYDAPASEGQTSTPTLKTFDTEQELTDYADMLNEAGGDLGDPEIPVMDSKGNSFLATLQAPGGDGWAFAYYGVNEPDDGRIQGEFDGGWVQPARLVGTGDAVGFELTWPVFGIVQNLENACPDCGYSP